MLTPLPSPCLMQATMPPCTWLVAAAALLLAACVETSSGRGLLVTESLAGRQRPQACGWWLHGCNTGLFAASKPPSQLHRPAQTSMHKPPLLNHFSSAGTAIVVAVDKQGVPPPR